MFSFRNIRTSQITIISGNSILESAMGPFISKLNFVQSVISFITGIVQTFLDGEQMRCHRQGFPLFGKLVLCYPTGQSLSIPCYNFRVHMKQKNKGRVYVCVKGLLTKRPVDVDKICACQSSDGPCIVISSRDTSRVPTQRLIITCLTCPPGC